MPSRKKPVPKKASKKVTKKQEEANIPLDQLKEAVEEIQGVIESIQNVELETGENTVDAMIYPRLKLKSEVFANVLDGSKTEFKIENEDDMEKFGVKGMEMNEEMQKVYEKEAKLIEKSLESGDNYKFQ